MEYKYRIEKQSKGQNRGFNWADAQENAQENATNDQNDSNVCIKNCNMAVVITGYIGHDSVLKIPNTIDDMPVISIDKKAFIGCKTLTEVNIASGIKEIGDYAFAQCTHLKKVTFEMGEEGKVDEIGKNISEKICEENAAVEKNGGCCCKIMTDDRKGKRVDIKIGRKTFEGCRKIENIYFKSQPIGTEPDSAKTEEDISFLAAAVVVKLPALSLLSDDDIGSSFWIERFDLALKNFIARDDMDGYDDTALCGEEDISYDGIGSVDGELPGESESFVREACKNKCYLCLLRLKHDSNLRDDFREYLENYIRKHSLGYSNEAAWHLIKEDLKNDPGYIGLFLDVLQPDIILLEKMLKAADGGQALLKSMLIAYNDKEREQDLFEGLLL